MSFETVSVIGLGYIGLPTAAMFASRKKKVIGVDVNQHAVDTINRGEIHIVEPELDIIVHAAVTEGYLKATTKPEPADAFLIAVPTPFKSNSDNENGIPEPDLTYIEAAAKAIATVLKKGDLVILESTSPVGATEQMAEWLKEARSDLSFPQDNNIEPDVNVAHCPERVLPGHVVRELVENDRVIGGMTLKCSEAAIKLYKTFVKGDCVTTNARTAEMAKLTENSCRDVQIAFANELSIICDKLDIDVWELISIANRHPRINILQPGPGVGGHCIAVDPWFIVSKTPSEARIIHTARKVNDAKPGWVLNKVKLALANYLLDHKDKVASEVIIACYGVAFKPDIDDLRESPALNIVVELQKVHSGPLFIVEPNITTLPENLEIKSKLVSTKEALIHADIHVMLVDHKEFKKGDVSFLNKKYLVDCKGIWENSFVD
ncbi:UDP-N-acetyl-D-mannosamine dehydrogenase [Psychrosphaera sp. F3M07]|uniref:UDP-N-acetyl-D-mannosamine dehydrogenase n=1 Tax=Psychrosphaera sp. F3M07 TaxID=2841560 RepID=UPI001C082B8F|nr:UDP-N-acetyl-D-mannosamine dehydrogenase [Psychrosphaera sp. F3M07]MBU2917744.1 UDP-N-acetyl-D-mannosamine dehydrogenase [Psychrosphaera sp. F3M07]